MSDPIAKARNSKAKDDRQIFIPITPGGTVLMHLKSSTEKKAIARLLEDAAHMPYGTWEKFKKRGYTIELMIEEDK